MVVTTTSAVDVTVDDAEAGVGTDDADGNTVAVVVATLAASVVDGLAEVVLLLVEVVVAAASDMRALLGLRAAAQAARSRELGQQTVFFSLSCEQ